MNDPESVGEAGRALDVESSANADSFAVSRNVLTGYAAWVVNLAIGLVVTPVLLHGLGVEGFGAWTLALTVASYVGVVELGLGVATVRRLAATLATGDTQAASAVAASARATYLVTAAVGAILLGALAGIAPMLVGLEGVSPGTFRVTVIIIGLGFILNSMAEVYPAIANGAGRADLGTTVGTAARFFTACSQAAVVLVTASLVGLAVVTALGVVCGQLAVRWVARRHFLEIDVRLANASRPIVRDLLASGWRNGAIAIAAAVGIQSDVVVVGAILGPTAVAAYGIAIRASVMAITLATKAADVLVPTFAHSTTTNDPRRTRLFLLESVFLTRAFLALALVALLAFGKPLLDLWLGDVPDSASTVLVLLVLGGIVAAPGHSSFILLTGMEKLRFLLYGTAITAVANLVMSIVLTRILGVVGPAIASLTLWLTWSMVVLPRYVGALLGIPWIPLSLAGGKSLSVAVITSSLLAAIEVRILGWDSPREALVGVPLLSLVYVGTLWMSLVAERRVRYRRLLRGAWRRQ